MRDETRLWLQFSEENLKSAQLLAESNLFNPCLQNIQQSVEKSLKAVCIEKVLGLKRTHSILELKRILQRANVTLDLSEDDCDFLDSIYLPTRYPLAGVLPNFEPNVEICQRGIQIASRVFKQIRSIL